jgi:integrase
MTEAHLRKPFGAVRAAVFGTRHVQQYIDARRKDKAADSTINRELSIVRRGFTLAIEMDPPLVTRKIHIPKLKENNARQGFLEYDQYVKLRGGLPEPLQAIFVLGYHTGIRLGELRSLRWEQIDFKAGEIKLAGPQTKNREPRTAPIYGEMGAWLEMQKARRDQTYPSCPWVFFYCGKRLRGQLKGWHEACEAAGVSGLLFHDLRRSAIRNMERAGIPRNVAMRISGHKTESVYRRYDIVNTRDLKNAAVRMEQYLKEQKEAGKRETEKQGPPTLPN